MSRRRKARVERGPDGSREVRLPPEEWALLEEGLDELDRLFVQKFGRRPEPDDPLFFDPDASEPAPITSRQIAEMEHLTVGAMRRAAISEAYIYAYKKTGMLLTTENEELFGPEEVDEFYAAMQEFDGLGP